MAYVEQHQLYDAALSIWKTTDRYNVRMVESWRDSMVLTCFADCAQHIRRLAV